MLKRNRMKNEALKFLTPQVIIHWKNDCHSLWMECISVSIFSIFKDAFLDGDIKIFYILSLAE